MKFNDFLNLSAKEINESMSEIFNLWQKDFCSSYPQLKLLLEMFIESTQGGKKIRGTLIRLGYLLNSDDVSQSVNTVAAIYEIMHAALLAHDDVVDKSILRRGKPSLYKKIGDTHYGKSQAICLGDLGFFSAYELLGNIHIPPENKISIMNVFTSIMVQTCVGQILDVKFSLTDSAVSEEDVIEMYKLKTSNYSIGGPLIIGALLGGVAKDNLLPIKSFGENLGIAFQLRDDLLDIAVDSSVTGKQSFTDIKEGKKTVLFLKAYKKANNNERKILDLYYGKDTLTNTEGEEVKKVFVSTGALKETEIIASEFVEKAKNSVLEISPKKDKQELLYGLVDYLSNRTY